MFNVTDEVIQEIVQEHKNDVFDIYMSIAYEEDIAGDGVVGQDNPDTAEKFKERIKRAVENFIKTIEGIIARGITKISNFLARVGQTDKGFESRCREAMIKNKPYPQIMLVSYQYNDNYLETCLQKGTSGVEAYLQTLKTTYAKLSEEISAGSSFEQDEAEAGGTTAFILRKYMNAGQDVDNLEKFFIEMRNGFRSSKKEIAFKAADARTYYNITRDYSKLKVVVDATQAKMKAQTNQIKSTLENIIHNEHVNEDVKRKAIEKFKKASEAYTFYVHFVDLYAQLKIEEVMTYRTVLKKLYHFG